MPITDYPQDNYPSPNSSAGKSYNVSLLPRGTIIGGKYEIVSVIAVGGYGAVYRVKHLELGTECALKVLTPKQLSAAATARFRKEAQTAFRLDHPNLVKAYDFDFSNPELPFMVMEYVHGPTLSQHFELQKRPLTLPQALEIFLPVCNALSYAHENGVIHRDIKPGNIMLAMADSLKAEHDFVPKVVDFGIAKLRANAETEALTQSGDIIGTPLYMSPEQCNGREADARSDVYSLGCVIFEALTGTPPFSGGQPIELLMKHNSEPAPTLKEATLGEQFPPKVEQLIAKMLAKDPLDRYQTIEDVGTDLLLLQAGNETSMRAGADARINTERNRIDANGPVNPLIAFLLVAIGAVFGAAAIFAWQSIARTSPAAPKLADPAMMAISKEENELPGPDFEAGYFSKEMADGRKYFEFPKMMESLGDLAIWRNGTRTLVPVVSGRPKQLSDLSKYPDLVMTSRAELMERPYLLGHFQSDDLGGIIAGFVGMDEDGADFVTSACSAQKRLAILDIDNLGATTIGFAQLGHCRDLRWLGLSAPRVVSGMNRESAEYKRRFIQGRMKDRRDLIGSDIAGLENLNQLVVLRLEDASELTPLIQALSKNKVLKGLSVNRCHTSNETWLLPLSGNTSLETLDLRTIVIRQPANMARLPNLKRLAMNPVLISPASVAAFPRLEELRLCGFDDELWTPERRELIKNLIRPYLPKAFDMNKNLHFDVTRSRLSYDNAAPRFDEITSRWFDPRFQNPAQLREGKMAWNEDSDTAPTSEPDADAHGTATVTDYAQNKSTENSKDKPR